MVANDLPNTETGINIQPAAMYYLTRLEGQLVRLNEIANHIKDDDVKILALRYHIHAAQAFATTLRNTLDPNKIDVV